MAGNLVQGALFTVMVVRAGMLRDPAFETDLAQQVERSPRFFRNAPVVLDLGRVSFMDAAGIRVLVDAHHRAARMGTTLTVRRPSPAVVRVLTIAGLLDHLHVEPSGEGAR